MSHRRAVTRRAWRAIVGRSGAVNTGEISGGGEPRDGALAIGYANGSAPPPPGGPDCAARLRLLGRYLVVEDNGACGGMNVSFSGIYVRNSQVKRSCLQTSAHSRQHMGAHLRA
jgi:hypothetical protein